MHYGTFYHFTEPKRFNIALLALSSLPLPLSYPQKVKFQNHSKFDKYCIKSSY